MKALARAILVLMMLVPFSLSAHPAKGPKKNKKKWGSQTAKVKKKKGQKKYGGDVIVKKKGKRKYAGTVIVKKKGKKKKHAGYVIVKKRRGGKARERRRVALLLSGRSWHVGPTVVPASWSVNSARFQRLLGRLDRAWGPDEKLWLVYRAASRRSFSVLQVRLLLREFHNPRVRLEALEILSSSIIDRHNFHRLLRAFEGRRAKRRAAHILARA